MSSDDEKWLLSSGLFEKKRKHELIIKSGSVEYIAYPSNYKLGNLQSSIRFRDRPILNFGLRDLFFEDGKKMCIMVYVVSPSKGVQVRKFIPSDDVTVEYVK